jgi:hypothetical protein
MNNSTRTQQKNLPQLLDDINNVDFPSDPTQIADMGYEFVEMGMYKEAYQFFCYGITIDDTDPDLLNGLGHYPLRTGRAG